MLFVLAAIGAVTIAVLLWRAFGVPAHETTPRSSRPGRTTAPDDDPEFLRSLNKHKPEEGEK